MSRHHNFTASYDTRGQTVAYPQSSYVNRPDYLNHGLDNGYETAPFPRRYYDRFGGLSWSSWDPQAIADPAYFYSMYGTSRDPLFTSRDGNQNAYWGAEYADYPQVANRNYTNWIGREFWREGKRGRPLGFSEMKNFLAGVAPNIPIFERQLPKPYIIISGARGRMDLKNRLVQIPAGAIIIFLAEPQPGDTTARYREYIESVEIRSRPSFY